MATAMPVMSSVGSASRAFIWLNHLALRACVLLFNFLPCISQIAMLDEALDGKSFGSRTLPFSLPGSSVGVNMVFIAR